MLAYRYWGGRELRLEEAPAPVLGGEGALVKIVACSICGTDVRMYRFGSEKTGMGRIVGHEMVGRVTELAPGLPGGFRVGDYVSMAPAIGCGECFNCGKGHTNMCDRLATMGFQYDGGFAEYAVFPKKAFLMGNVYALPPLPDPVPFTLSEPLACVINAQSYLCIEAGEDVAIFGSGIIGCMHAELARSRGARVFIVEPALERRRQAEELLDGVTFIAGEKEGAAREIIRLTGGKGADAAIIACSAGSAQRDGLESLAKCGRLSLFGGLPGDGLGFLDSNLIHYREIGVFGAHASTPAQNRAAMELLRSGKINAGRFISKRYPLCEIETAFKEAAEGSVLKAVVVMEKS
ncbi:MAG: alcohol dehydrogenase catalytic domain-containing protein [Treponema sp.]|jgi:L-iditol 2-dehydrogenase|nr:alcohol dehydrogenase catalytic domain-containing protein [Treponema sp.]